MYAPAPMPMYAPAPVMMAPVTLHRINPHARAGTTLACSAHLGEQARAPTPARACLLGGHLQAHRLAPRRPRRCPRSLALPASAPGARVGMLIPGETCDYMQPVMMAPPVMMGPVHTPAHGSVHAKPPGYVPTRRHWPRSQRRIAAAAERQRN
jgi:hypothetical protein